MGNNISLEEMEKSKEIINKIWNYYSERIVRAKRTWNFTNYNAHDKPVIYF